MHEQTSVWSMILCGALLLGGLDNAVPARAQEVTGGNAARKLLHQRTVSIELTNATGPGGRHVSGEGVFPLHMNIIDKGTWIAARRLQVFVAIYTKPEVDTLKPGVLFFTEADPRFLKTDPDKIGRDKFEWDIPLLPGDYVAHVYLCDPDTPYPPPPANSLFTLPDPAKFPGRVKKFTAISVHVDPEEHTQVKE